jgi:hypothetical protein
MKRHYILYKEDPTKSCLDDEQAAILAALGFSDKQKEHSKLAQIVSEHSWDGMFDELHAFHEQHGHTRVPTQPRSMLRNWIVRQREQFERLKQKGGQKSSLNPSRIAKLAGLGFSFGSQVTRLTFEERAVQWLEYRNKHGKDPPREDHGIGSWIGRMRRHYLLYQQGQKSPTTNEQFDQLNEWGFKWTCGLKKPEKVEEAKPWEERLQELIAYKAENGHVNVPQKAPGLGHWVHSQRRHYTLMKEGKRNRMTPEKVAKLKEIGFVFCTRNRPRKSNGEARPAFSDEEEENPSSSDEEEEEEITPVENRTMMMNNTHAHEQTAFAPWARYQLNYPSL